jgi:hypothetical protein
MATKLLAISIYNKKYENKSFLQILAIYNNFEPSYFFPLYHKVLSLKKMMTLQQFLKASQAFRRELLDDKLLILFEK